MPALPPQTLADREAQARNVLRLMADKQWTMVRACDAVGLTPSKFSDVLNSVPELARHYVRTRELQADLEVDDALSIADNENIDPARARNMIDIRKWRASKFRSNVYGDRIDVSVQGSISITDALSAARARVSSVRSISDPALTMDAEIVVPPSIGRAGASDTVSDGASNESGQAGGFDPLGTFE